jgi:hypothetical protein
MDSNNPSRPSDGHVAHPDAAYDEDESAETQLLTAVRHMVRDGALVNEIGTAGWYSLQEMESMNLNIDANVFRTQQNRTNIVIN